MAKKKENQGFQDMVEETNQKKRLEDYEQSEPVQLALFQFDKIKERHYSSTIALYDFLPKYHWGKAERIAGEFLRPFERDFEYHGRKYTVEVSPARIKDKSGKVKDYYPSKREELVEDALRRFATAEQGVFLDGMAGVKFTLYQLQNELKRNGHSYSKDQIKDALLICAKTSITVKSDDGKNVLVSNLFETLGLQTREDWKETGKKTQAFVRFNSLVTASIKNGSYRQFDYKTAMSYNTVIARQLHKRMSHNYTQADITKPYGIKLSTIIRDLGLAEYDRPSLNLRQVIKSLEEMKEKNVILSYKIEKSHDPMNRNKLIDAKFIIIPHPIFADEIRKANVRAGRIERQLQQDK